MRTTVPKPHPCPRCGYDQSGVIDAWRESCPLLGRCSECGLDMVWAEVLRPERFAPRWSFEHVRPARVTIALVKTIVRSVRSSFWSRMPITAPIHPGRLFILAILLAALLHGVAVVNSVRLNVNQVFPIVVPAMAAPAVQMTYPVWDELWPHVAQPYFRSELQYIPALPVWGVLLAMWGLLTPLPYLVLIDTMKQAKVRRVHLLRGFVYALPKAIMAIAISALYQWLVEPSMYIHNFDSIMFLLAMIVGGFSWWKWWRAFSADYLRLNRGGLIAAVMLVIALLSTLLIGMFCSGDLRLMIPLWLA